MKLKKILRRLKSYLDGDEEKLQLSEEGLNAVLEKLRSREIELLRAIEGESDTEGLLLLKQELAVLSSQKKKGVILLKRMRDGREQSRY